MNIPSQIDALISQYEQIVREGRSVTPEQLCQSCPELLNDVCHYIGRLQGMNDHLDQTVLSPAAASMQPANEIVSAQARYRPLHVHARGGLGEVLRTNDESLSREVALKRMRPHVQNDAGSQKRFLREAEITARLEHPGIVPIHTVIQNNGAPPSYVMRFIEGESLAEAIVKLHGKGAEAVDFSGLEFRQLLQRFISVCNTFAYAHSRGIIHRDVKPANIMLGKYGETLVVDWGLAKDLGRIGPEETAVFQPTDTPPVPGPATPGPTPNQGDALTAQGAIVGTPAFMSPEQAAGGADAVGPASDVYGLGATLYALLTGKAPFSDPLPGPLLRAVRQGEFPPPRRLNRDIPVALDAICTKAMALQPRVRYETALALAADIERWLADEPVSACRDPWPIRARRWGRRHRVFLTASGALSFALLIGLAATAGLLTWTNRSIRTERDRASTEAAKAGAINHFLIKDLLDQATPERNAVGAKVTVRELLDRAAKKLDKAFDDQPEVEASLRQCLGDAYYRLGLYADADQHLRRAVVLREDILGAEHADTVTTQQSLAASLHEQGQHARAEEMRIRILDVRRRQLGPHAPETLVALNNLGSSLAAQEKWADAERIFRTRREALRDVRDADHEDTLTTLNNLAMAARQQGKLAEAEDLYREALVGWRKRGEDYPATLSVQSNLASVLFARDRLDEAETLFRAGLTARRHRLGSKHPDTLLALNNLTMVVDRRGKTTEAEELFREVKEGFAELLGPEHPNTLVAAHNHALAVLANGKASEAAALLSDVVAARRRALPPSHPNLAASLDALGKTFLQLADVAKAEPCFREAVTIYTSSRPAGHADRARTEGRLGECLVALKRHQEAETLLLSSFEAQSNGPTAADEAIGRLIQLYEGWNRPEQAQAWRDRRTQRKLQ